jgi:hypothetical protein
MAAPNLAQKHSKKVKSFAKWGILLSMHTQGTWASQVKFTPKITAKRGVTNWKGRLRNQFDSSLVSERNGSRAGKHSTLSLAHRILSIGLPLSHQRVSCGS